MHVHLKSRATNAYLVSHLKSFANGSYLPNRPFELLVVGVSNRDYLPSGTKWHVTNRFDDWIVHVWRDKDGVLKTRWCPATLEPGAEAVAAGQTGNYRGKAVNKNGAGCLVLGFHEKIWYPHLHNWKYPALCMKKFTNIRRNQSPPSSSSKAIFTPGSTILNSSYTFNCHRTKLNRNRNLLSKHQIVQSIYRKSVGHWSHGCAVHLFNDDLMHLMKLSELAPKSLFFSARENRDVNAPEISYLIVSGEMLSAKTNKSDFSSLREITDSQNFVTKAHGLKPKSNYELANMCNPVSGRSFGDIAFYNNDLHPMFVTSFNRVAGYDNGQWLETSINYRDLLVVGRLK